MEFKRIKAVNQIEAYRRIMETRGKIFGLTFQKLDGSYREGTFRLGVKKGITGQGLKFDPIEKGLVTVYDTRKKAFRMFNLDRLHSVRTQKVVYAVFTNL